MSAAVKAHVAAFAFPFGTHAAPLLQLLQRLAAAAPAVRFSFFNTAGSNRKILSKVNLASNLKAYDVEDGLPHGHVMSGNPMEAIGMFINVTPGNFRRQLGEAVKEIGIGVTCLLTDAFLWFSADIADEMGIPWVALWTSGPTAISLHMYTDEIRAKLGKNWNPDETLEFLPGMAAIRADDLPFEILKFDNPLAHLLHEMGRVLPRAAAVILNSFPGIDPIVESDLKSKLRMYLPIGPSPPPPPSEVEDQSGCLAWLNQNHHSAASVAYISFGSMLTPPPPELLAIAEAIEDKKIPYLWSLRDNSQRHLLESFFERTKSTGKVVDWAPQPEVLAHGSVGVFVTHCGWNSVMESIIGGVPMICRPFLGDQMVNRRRVEDTWEIGVGVEGGVFSKWSVGRALEITIKSEKGKKMRDNIGRLRECAIGENRSSTVNFNSLFHIIAS